MPPSPPDPRSPPPEEELRLPRLPKAAAGGDEDWRPEDDDDLGIGGENEAGLALALDTETGVGEPIEDELPETGQDEETRWTQGSEAAGEVEGTQEEFQPGPEYGWVGEEGPNTELYWDDEELGTHRELGRADDGSEGIVDEGAAEWLGELPPLVAASQDEVGDVAEWAEFSGPPMPDEVTLEVLPGTHWSCLDAAQLAQQEVTTLAAAPQAVGSGGGIVVAATGDVLWYCADGAVPQALPLQAPCVDLSLLRTGQGALLAVATEQALLLGTPGEPLAPLPSTPEGDEPLCHVALSGRGEALHIWAARRTGPLWCSSDQGHSWQASAAPGPVGGLSGDGGRTLSVMQLHPEGPRLLRSHDGGEHFERMGTGDPGAAEEARVAVLQGSLCARLSDGSLWHAPVSGDPENLLDAGAHGFALVDEDDEVHVYVWAELAGHGLLLRRGLGASDRPFTVVYSEAAGDAPRWLAARYSDGITSLDLWRDGRWSRWRVRIDGGRFA